MYTFACLPSHNMTFLPLGNAKLCSIIVLIITGITNTQRQFSWEMIVAEWGRFQDEFLQARLISLDMCFQMPLTFSLWVALLQHQEDCQTYL